LLSGCSRFEEVAGRQRTFNNAFPRGKTAAMSPIEEDIIRRKLAIIIENLKALGPIQRLSREEYARDIYKRKATERLLQELIEAAIDVNTHLIVRTGNEAPDDYYQSFTKAGELGVIPGELADKLAPSAGLGNRLVHEYDLLEHSLVFDSVKKADELYAIYVLEIENFISRDVEKQKIAR
jgi:uncharacterized protein YutE (UPF0331/DUF86 family)